MNLRPIWIGLLTVACGLLFASAPANAVEPRDSATAQATAGPRDAKAEIPTLAFAYSAFGTQAGTYGALGYGSGLAGGQQKATGGGGVIGWGSPIDRLTVIVDAPRDVYLQGHFAPSAAAIVRLFGTPGRGFAFSGLAKYKVEGFGTDPNGDTESEIEGGLLLSYAGAGLHLDLNAITGFGLTEEGEIDTEARARFGYDASRWVRVGVDGQGRYRLAGTKKLLNGSSYDFAGGPQVAVGSGAFFGAFTFGPTTMGVSNTHAVGGTAILSLCGMM
jgi:hypothetical protein